MLWRTVLRVLAVVVLALAAAGAAPATGVCPEWLAVVVRLALDVLARLSGS